VTPAPGSHDLEPTVGPDLAFLARRRGVPLAGVTVVSRWPSASRQTGAFRLEFGDGSVLKGHRLANRRRAFLVERLLGLAGPPFPQVVARRGAAVLVPWIPGTALSSIEASPAILEECGRVLGALHGQPVPAWRTLPVRGPGQVRIQCRIDLGLLAGVGAIEETMAHRADEAAAAHAPDRATTGVIHNDFCAENIVIDPAGTPVPVDNATMTFGPHDLDLARTWHRWPMTPPQAAAFFGGYQQERASESFRRHAAFWIICALAGAAANRVRAGVGGVEPPLERLAEFLAALPS
jgi:aminoglycoside phosphotransferase (APT) family kinase protein